MKLQITNYKLQIKPHLVKVGRWPWHYSPFTIHHKPAFTLIEALIVMVILASSMTAALYLMTTVVFSTQKNLARTKAVYLAQECTELARNLRDTAWLKYQPWDCAFGVPGDEFIISHAYSGNPAITSCNGLEAAITIEPYTGGDNNQLYQDGALINHNLVGNNTGYRRTLHHAAPDPDGNPDTLDLSCEVTWRFNGRPQQVNVNQTLTNWRKN